MDNFFSAPDYQLIRTLFERSLAFLYFIAFLSAFNQFPALLGENGLLPAPRFLKQASFQGAPGFFHWRYSDRLLKIVCGLGLVVALFLAALGSGHIPIPVHILLWLFLYAAYLSIVNIGQTFYGFGWESMLLEMGYFMAFMGPEWVEPSWIPILILRWMLFRTELGAGLIKIRGDACWRNLTCLYYHHETQPMPNPLSRFFHHAPQWFHRAGVVFSHFVQLVVPFGIFFPQPVAAIAGAFIIIHQMILVISGNYSWLNWLTIVLGLLCLPDFVSQAPGETRPLWFGILQIGIGLFALVLSYRPALNLIAKNQKMNYCWNRYHLVGAYGAFGSVTKERYEIVLEGTLDGEITEHTVWKEYEFKGKPTSLSRTPPQVAPYHLRLDWLMWFLPFSVNVGRNQIRVWGYDEWFIRLVMKLLQKDENTLKLLKSAPFDQTPVYIRALFYHYQFTLREEGKHSGHVWKRRLIDHYLPPVSLNDLVKILQ